MARTERVRRSSEKTPRKRLVSAKRKLFKPRRNKPGTLVRREIKRLQKDNSLIIPKAAFERLVREIMQDYKFNLRISPDALEMLHREVEAYMVDTFATANMCARNDRRMTVQLRDMVFVNMKFKRRKRTTGM